MNPNRYRAQDDFGRRDDDRGWDARDQRYDEGRSWFEGDGGRTAEAWRGQGQYQRGDYAPSRSSGPAYGYDGGGPRQSGDRHRREERDQPDYRGSTWSRADYDRPDYGRPAYSRSPYPDHGYAPGAQIWEGSGPGLHGERRDERSRHDFEPDYLHWREQQMSAFDRDYHDWRSERREKFSADFDNWRSTRPRVQAENPIVGDVADGGVGDASELKKR